MAELITFGETMLRLSPPAGSRLETTRSLDAQVGGAESNVAVAATCLGVDAAWLSKLPDSPLGRRVAGALRSHGVDPVVAWDDRERARLGTYYLEYGAEPRQTSVIYDRANASITTVSASELAVDEITDCDVFHTTGITPALSTAAAETTDALLAAARDAGTLRSFDLNYRAKLWSTDAAAAAYDSILPETDLLFAPIRDANAVLGYEGDGERVARGLAADYDIDCVVVTLGSEGSLALVDDTLLEQGVYSSETVDKIGTGDAFVGGMLGELLSSQRRSSRDENEDLLAVDRVDDALASGAAAAALKRTISGDVLVATRREIDAVLDGAGDGISR